MIPSLLKRLWLQAFALAVLDAGVLFLLRAFLAWMDPKNWIGGDLLLSLLVWGGVALALAWGRWTLWEAHLQGKALWEQRCQDWIGMRFWRLYLHPLPLSPKHLQSPNPDLQVWAKWRASTWLDGPMAYLYILVFSLCLAWISWVLSLLVLLLSALMFFQASLRVARLDDSHSPQTRSFRTQRSAKGDRFQISDSLVEKQRSLELFQGNWLQSLVYQHQAMLLRPGLRWILQKTANKNSAVLQQESQMQSHALKAEFSAQVLSLFLMALGLWAWHGGHLLGTELTLMGLALILLHRPVKKGVLAWVYGRQLRLEMSRWQDHMNTRTSSKSKSPSIPMGEICLTVHGAVDPWVARTQQQPLDWTLRAGEIWWIQGANGTGKSTFLQWITGQRPLSEGHRDSKIRCGRSAPGTVHFLWDCKLWQRFEKRNANVWGLEVFIWLKFLGIAPLYAQIHHQLLEDGEWSDGELSLGQRQRWQIWVALCSSEGIVLLDEPVSGLPSAERGKVLAWLASWAQSNHQTLVLATHDAPEIPSSASQLWKILSLNP
jgi:ABC-2 type transport system ATP-binding protein